MNTATPVTYQVHTDHLGRPVAMTDGAKATVWSAAWTPWGEAQSLTGSAINNLRFPGQYFLIETGHAYNWHRTYDPVSGRYTQPDPLRFIDGPSVYAYAGNSPFMNTDRVGLSVDPSELPHSPALSNGNGADSCEYQEANWKRKLREICVAAWCYYVGEEYQKIELPPPQPRIEQVDSPKKKN